MAANSLTKTARATQGKPVNRKHSKRNRYITVLNWYYHTGNCLDVTRRTSTKLAQKELQQRVFIMILSPLQETLLNNNFLNWEFYEMASAPWKSQLQYI